MQEKGSGRGLISICAAGGVGVLPFARWGDVFGGQVADAGVKVVAAAVVDRIVHHADVLTLQAAPTGSSTPGTTKGFLRAPARNHVAPLSDSSLRLAHGLGSPEFVGVGRRLRRA